MLERRVIIVDFNHMAHTYYHSKFRLDVRVVENGEVVIKDTTIQNGTIKNIHKWSHRGAFPTAVCFDRPVPARKAYFQTYFPEMKVGTAGEYKGGRERMPEEMFQGISDAERILRSAGVSCFSEANYESDDLIFACVKRAKEKYPGMPIDIITNDADLLPLVDDTVSVFLRSKTSTYAVDKSLEKAHYVQVTPENYQNVVESLSAYRGFLLPYNTLLLHKLLRGDPSDNYHSKEISRMFSAKKWNAMMEQMIADGVDIQNIFRYGESTYKILYKDTNLPFDGTLQDALSSPEKSNLYQKIGNSKELDAILNVLKKYSSLSEEQLLDVEKMYWGMNLNQVYPNGNPRLSRRAYVVGSKGKGDIEKFNEIELQKMLSPLKIRLGGLN